MERTDVLVAGAGLAGTRTAEALRAGGFDGRILVHGAEPLAAYDRPALSKDLMLGRRPATALALRPAGWHEGQGIEMRLGEPVLALDLDGLTATTTRGEVAAGTLVLAMGARPRRLPGVPDAAGVHHLRTLPDALALRAGLGEGRRVVVAGAGFVGAEVATSACALGAEVTVVEALPAPMSASLGEEVGRVLARRMGERGIGLRCDVGVAGVRHAGGRLVSVLLTDGDEVPGDMLVVGVGSVPETTLVDGQLDPVPGGGVPTDELGRTAVPGVLACGDVASAFDEATGRHRRLEHWTAAAATAARVAAAIMGTPPPPPQPPYVWSDQLGWRLQVVGTPDGGDAVELEDAPGGLVARYRDACGAVTALLVAGPPDEDAAGRAALIAGARAELAARARPRAVAR